MEINLISDKKNSHTLPPLYIPLLSAAGICGLTFLLYMVYPVILGKAAAWLLGWGPIPLFFATHPDVYGFVQDIIRGFYTLTALGLLSVSLFFFTYLMLDESITHLGNRKALLAFSIRAVKPFIFLQLILALIGTLVCWKIDSFTALAWLPSFGTASFWRALYTAGWEVCCIMFACAFALTEHWRTSLSKVWTLLISYPLFWLFFAAVLWVGSFVPAWSLNRFGLTGSAWYIAIGTFLQLAGLTMGLLMLFHQSGEFEVQQPCPEVGEN